MERILGKLLEHKDATDAKMVRIDARFDTVDSKLDQLLKFRWQSGGAYSLLIIIATLAVDWFRH